MKSRVSKAEFYEAHRTLVNTPTGQRPGGFNVAGFDIEIEGIFVNWTCQMCLYRSHHKNFGRDIYICSSCGEGYELKIVAPEDHVDAS